MRFVHFEMKIYASILFSLVSFFLMAQDEELNKVRKAFHKAVVDEAESKSFHSLFSTIKSSSATIDAYQATSEAMLARVLWNPFSKLEQVKKYDSQIEKAVGEAPNDLEIRFLRMSIEYNLPSFLGMKEHIEEDLEVILNNLASVSSLKVDPDYGRFIFYFIESTGLCTPEQIKDMKMSFKDYLPEES